MILGDTSVRIDAIRTGDPKLIGLFKQYGGTVCGVVRAELLHRLRRPQESERKSLPSQTAGDPPAGFAHGFAQTDPDLARVLERWSDLPAHIKAAILALVASAQTAQNSERLR